jgi:transcriptional regulator with XRE-family HTH domain
MNKTKRENLEKRGWKVGSAKDFLGLTPEEESYIELKLSLGHYLQEKRKAKHLTQIQMAKLVHSSQSRVAKMEKAEPSVSIDLIVRSLFALGTEPTEIADILVEMAKEERVPYNKRIEPTARGRHATRLRERRAGSA